MVMPGTGIVPSEFPHINWPGDLKPFAGQFVAYKAYSIYFKSIDAGIHCDRQVQFGFVSEKTRRWAGLDEQAYHLTRLLECGDYPAPCPLIISKVKSAFLGMRLATPGEIRAIGKVIDRGEAKLQYIAEDGTWKTISVKKLAKL